MSSPPGFQPWNFPGGFASEQSSLFRWRFFSGLAASITCRLNCQVAQLTRIDIGRGLGHQIHPAIVFWECHYVPDRFGAAEQHHQPIEPERDPAMRRRAQTQSTKQMTEQ